MKPTEMEAQFWKFVCKRHTIYEDRFIKKMSPPWTDDPILKKFKFTNVMRRLDRGTKYMISKILDQYWSGQQSLAAIVAYRLVNKTETWDIIDSHLNKTVWGNLDFDFDGLLAKLLEHRKAGNPLFTSAYIVHSGNMRLREMYPGNQKMARVLQVFKDLLRDSNEFCHCKYEDLLKAGISPQEQMDLLQKIPMVGKFTAYEIWCDLTYCNYKGMSLIEFSENDYVNVGPGCHAGAKWIYGEDVEIDEVVSKLYYLRDSQDEHIKYLGLYFPSCEGSLNIRDVEHSFCEFNKYWRTMVSKGQPKSYFTPRS